MAGISHLPALLNEVTVWCEQIMLACLPYALLTASALLYLSAIIIGSGIFYAVINGSIKVIKSHLAFLRLPLIDRGFSVVIVKDKTRKFAFTYGLIRPRIFVSSGLISKLSRREVRGVILHEIQHKKNKDPLRFFLFSLLKDTFFYLPICRWFSNESTLRLELEADDFAAKKTKKPIELANALVKVATSINLNVNTDLDLQPSISGNGGHLALRVKRLLDERKSPEIKTPLPFLITIKSVAIALLLFFATTFPLLTSASPAKSCDKTHCSISTHNKGSDCVTHCRAKDKVGL